MLKEQVLIWDKDGNEWVDLLNIDSAVLIKVGGYDNKKEVFVDKTDVIGYRLA